MLTVLVTAIGAQAVFYSEHGSLDPGVNAQFAKNGFYMQFDRSVRDAQVAGNHLVTLALGQQGQYFIFTRC